MIFVVNLSFAFDQYKISPSIAGIVPDILGIADFLIFTITMKQLVIFPIL